MKRLFSLLLVCCLTFTGTTFASAAFKDVSRDYWAKDEITYLTDKKVINGFYDNSFRPQAPVTRLQAMILMARALNLDLSNRPNPGFKDLSTMNSGYKYAAAIVDEGIFPKSAYLKPNEPMTRELMARMLTSGFKLKSTKKTSFKDVPPSYWAYPYISALAENNITLGYPDGTFKPSTTLTRAQFSVFLAKALNDNFKTFTFSNEKYHFKLELPNYMKSQVVFDDGLGINEDKVFSVNFYYNNDTHLGYTPFAGSIHIIPASLWKNFFEDAPYYLIKKINNYYYCYQGQSEDPYYEVGKQGSREAKTYMGIHDRLEYAIKHMKIN
ncbi:S-layer homology domain-containing protein [Pseudobacillus sp. 179-B 2D1 NHS]|uniref:S-layer homology domain-containing protein n=1 Tax=Pseudobacillus sp. 179-B 2D1 NHS TaxID=3374292 RepID=UPI00387A58FB